MQCLSVLLRQLEYSKLPETKYLLAYSAIIFDQNMTVFSPTQLIFPFDPKRAETGEGETVVCTFYHKELYKLSMSKDN